MEQLQTTLSLYGEGARAWFPHDTLGWIGGTVSQCDCAGASDQVRIVFLLDNGLETVFACKRREIIDGARELPFLQNPPVLEGADDLTQLSYLNEPAVLHTVKRRYAQQWIYTYSGIVLIAMNPFKSVPLYTREIMQQYSGRKRTDAEPHVFAVAEEAYRAMLQFGGNQSIIVSGESGAGKTQSAKYIMRYFASVEALQDGGQLDAARGGMTEIEEAVLSTNPIMEAFGNAKTTRNDNSSRFGKYIEIQFSKSRNGRVSIAGARVRTYLLERSRVVFQAATERSYHIFYQLCAGAPAAERRELALGSSWEHWAYLRQGNTGTIAGVDDSGEFAATQRALSTIGIQMTTQWNLFRVLAAILHIGNAAISTADDGESAHLAADDAHLGHAARLLGVPADALSRGLLERQLKTRFETITRRATPAQAIASRDSLAKQLFSASFDWIVQTVNASLAMKDGTCASFIGVLDIYGFEHFAVNSFEQFCINYANEKLQQEFNQHVFKLEQEEYVEEQIDWRFIDFSDNQPCISLIEDRLGILALLDEASRLPSGTDESFTLKLYSEFGDNQSKTAPAAFFEKPRFGQESFTVRHYATPVTYTTTGFLAKNKESVSDEQLAALLASENALVRDLFAPLKAAAEEPAPAGKAVSKAASKAPTLGGLFKASLISLMGTIHSTQAHYIRCIKPNAAKVAFEFDPLMVLQQLRACGVLETIRISCAGYPSRWTYREFCERYYLLVASSAWRLPDRNLVERVISETPRSDADQVQFGRTKVFMRAGMLALLEKLRLERINRAAAHIQRAVRAMLARKRFLAIRRAVVVLQACARGFLARRLARRARAERAARLAAQQKAAAIRIQAVSRGFLARREAEYRRRARQEAISASKAAAAAVATAATAIAPAVVSESPAKLPVAPRDTQEVAAGARPVALREKRGSAPSLSTGAPPRDASRQAELELASAKARIAELEREKVELEREKAELGEKLQQALSKLEAAREKTAKPSRPTAAAGTATAPQRAQNETSESAPLSRRRTTVSSTGSSVASLTTGLSISDGRGLLSDVGRAVAARVALTPELAAKVERELAILHQPAWEDELLENVVCKLRIPLPSNHTVLQPKDVFFPSHLLGMCMEKLVQYDMTLRALTLSQRVSDMLQQLTSRFEDDYMSAYWLSNCVQFLAVLGHIRGASAIAQHPASPPLSAGDAGPSDTVLASLQEDADRLVVALHRGWMNDLRRRLGNMIVPAIIENQSLPGYVCRRTGGIWNRLRTATSTVAYTIDQLLSFLTKLHKTLACYYTDPGVSKQVLLELFHTVGVQSFNHLLMRRNFCTWKRGVQIQYNLSRLEEWCQTHQLPDATIHLQQLQQATKILTLNKNSPQDINTLFDVCYLLNPAQIRKVIALYTPDDYEAPLAPDVLQALSNRPSHGNDAEPLLLDSDDSNVEFQLPNPPAVESIRRFFPNWNVAPHLKQVADLS